MFKNTASQKLTVFAFADAGHATLDAGEPVTGDAANITMKVEQDDDGTQSASNDTNPAEVEDGQYRFDLTQAETNGDKLTFYPESSTAGVQVIALPSQVIYTRPPNFPDLGIESDGDLTKVNTLDGHTAQTGDSFARIGAAGASLTAVPWNASWDAEVQSEVADALAVFWTSAGTLVDLIWDEVLTGGTHNVSNSAGRRIRQMQDAGGYSGSIWLNTVSGSSGTTTNENGTDTNQSDNIADTFTLAAALGITRIMVAPGSSVTLGANSDGYVFEGEDWDLDLNGQSIAGATFRGANVLASTATGSGAIFERGCIFDADVTLAPCIIRDSFLGNMTMTVGAAGDYYLNNCFDRATGLLSPSFDFAAVANTNLNVHDFHGALEVENMGGSGTDTLVMSGSGIRFVGNANCTAGAVTLLGVGDAPTDNSSNLTISTDGFVSIPAINAEVDTAIETYHLDHLLAVDYDPASKPGTATALLNELIESNAGVSRYTAAALAQAPSGGGGGDATEAKQDTIIAAIGTMTDLGGGADIANNLADIAGATFSSASDSLEAVRNQGDAAWITATGFNTDSTATIVDAVWDEVQTGHTTAGTFGKYLDAAISGVGGAVGSGADSVTLTIQDGSGNPIADADVWITNDEAGANVVAGTSQTNSLGKFTFQLDAGLTYYRWVQKDGWNFTNPQSFVAVAD